jgi:cardiolipin synthase A/B
MAHKILGGGPLSQVLPILAREPGRIPRRYRSPNEQFVQGNTVRLLRDGREAFPAMLKAIAGARFQILLEMYWFGGKLGAQFVEALVEAKKRGVEVAMIYDALGSIDTPDSLFKPLIEAGIALVEYHPLLPWKRRFQFGRISSRDHRKVLVVDEDIGFTGGLNIADQWLPVEDGGAGWRDDCIQVQGPAAGRLAARFHRVWGIEGGAPIQGEPSVAESPPSRAGVQNVRVLGEAYRRNRLEIVRAYIAHIWNAQERVWIRNSYFVPDFPVARALRHAARRGVDVRIILPGKIDIKVVRYASRAMWGSLLRAGVRIYEWDGDQILHAKSAVIDSEWSTVGTFNLDHRSAFANLEINLAVRDHAFGGVMDRSFEQDFTLSREVDPHEFRFRSLGDRFLELFTYQFRRLM